MRSVRPSDRPLDSDPAVSPGLAEKDSSHAVQFYSDESFLLSASATFLEATLQAGGVGLLLATPEHLAALEQSRHLQAGRHRLAVGADNPGRRTAAVVGVEQERTAQARTSVEPLPCR